MIAFDTAFPLSYMLIEEYDVSFRRPILNGLKEQGWRLYPYSKNGAWDSSSRAIREGPTSKLILGITYILFPAVDDPVDPRSVKAAMRNFKKRTGKGAPVIELGERDYMMGCLEFLKRAVKVYTSDGLYVSYRDFMDSIYTLTPAFD